MRRKRHLEAGARHASRGHAERGADGQARERRHAFKVVLDSIASPAIRLHRYRSVHNRLLQDALCARDCLDARTGCG